MMGKKLQISIIEDKIELEDVEIQSNDPCKDIWMGVVNCLRDCANQTPRGGIWY